MSQPRSSRRTTTPSLLDSQSILPANCSNNSSCQKLFHEFYEQLCFELCDELFVEWSDDLRHEFHNKSPHELIRKSRDESTLEPGGDLNTDSVEVTGRKSMGSLSNHGDWRGPTGLTLDLSAT
jgi:hypothetical protein